MQAKAVHPMVRLLQQRLHHVTTKFSSSQMLCTMMGQSDVKLNLRQSRHRDVVLLLHLGTSPSPSANLNLNHASLAGRQHRSLVTCAINRI